MRENSRRGAQRPSPGSGRAAAGRDARRRGVGSWDAPGSARDGGTRDRLARGARRSGAGSDGMPPGPGNRRQAPKEVEVARLTSIIEPILGALNLDMEAVKVAMAGRRRVLRIIVDADGGVGLDEIAVASREVTERLDATNAMGDAPYTLEVSSPGVDRPLTQPRHWRRAAGRLVAVQITGCQRHSEQDTRARPFTTQARVIGADHDGVTLEISGTRRTFGYTELGPGRVQVEFARLDELGGTDDADSPGDGADEEDRDGH